MKKLLGLAVSCLALIASTLANAATPGPVAAGPEPTHGETPLHVRPATALEPAPSSANPRWKLLAFAVIAAGGLWIWKRRAHGPVAAKTSDLALLRRTGIGVRTELVLIEIEGQRLLLGVTPHSIQTLYIVPESPTEDIAAGPVSEEDYSTLARRLAGVLDPREEQPSPRNARPTRASRGEADDGENVEEQARGLLALGGRR